MAFTPNPPIPDRADKATFPSRMYNMWVWLAATISELSTLGSAYNLATSGTSVTSNTIGTGSKSFTVAAGLGLLPGMPLNIARTSAAGTTSMFGYVTSYSGTSLVFNAVSSLGSGTYTDWTFSLAASAGGATLGANIFTALQRWAVGSNIASAATVDLTAATGNTINITGTTTTSAFTITAGQWMLLIPTGAWPLTYHATNCNINGGFSYTCQAGDRVYVGKDAAGVTYVNVITQSGRSLVASKPVQERQTVLAGPVDTAGLPTFLPSTSASLVLTMQNVSPTASFVVTSANGSNLNGDVNRVGEVTGNTLSWTVGASTTSYLPVTVNADGTLTSVTPVTLAPIYQIGGTPSVTNNQYTYNIQESKMYKGNGATAPQVNDVIIGEAVSAASTITSTVAYAILGQYDSGYTATLPAATGGYSKNHNVGTNLVKVTEIIECTTTDLGYAVGDILEDVMGNTATGGYQPGKAVTSKSVTIRRPATNSYSISHITTGTLTALTAGSWKYKIIAKRRF